MPSAVVIGMPMKLDDETLMAYADGTLEPERLHAVEEALAGDAAARATVERFRATGALLALAYPEEPVPELHERRVRAKVRPPNGRRPRRTLPLAAGVALTLGLVAGWSVARHGVDPLTAALGRTPSGESREIADGRAITPTATFRDTAGRWCRAFEEVRARGKALGAACREADGAWRLVLLVPEGVAMSGDGYAPAGEEPSPGDALLATLRAGEPVDAATERALIRGGWR